MKFDTRLIHSTDSIDPFTGSVNVPIYQTSTFKQSQLGVTKGYEYARTGNPTRHALETLIADLEQGHQGFAFASGLAAITTALALFKQGDHLIVSDNVYGGTFRLLDKVFSHFDLRYTRIDTGSVENVTDAIQANTVALFIESPTNPLLSISSIKELGLLAKERHLLLLVDNTFMSPYLQQPLTLGADLVIHSATKYLGGHSDLIAGLIVTKAPELSERISFLQNAMGAVLGPQDSFLLIRGIKTLAVRMRAHLANTKAVLAYLETSPFIEKIHHPLIHGFKNQDIFLQETKGNVALISFVLKDTLSLNIFLENLSIITLGESLGGVESLISHPATMTHAAFPADIRASLGISDHLVRLSIGIEDEEDLIADLDQALLKAGHHDSE